MLAIKKYLALTLVVIIAAMGPSLTIKAAVGLGAFDALNQSLAYLTGFRVGDILTVLQLVFVAIQLLILKKNATIRIFLQIPLAAIFGQLINFYLYTVLGSFEVDNYLARMAMFLIGIVWVAFFISAIMALDIVTMPVESLSMVLANTINKSFGFVRQAFDVIFVVLALVLTFMFSLPLTIREGTIIAAIIFGPLMGIFIPIISKQFIKWDLITANPED